MQTKQQPGILSQIKSIFDWKLTFVAIIGLAEGVVIIFHFEEIATKCGLDGKIAIVWSLLVATFIGAYFVRLYLKEKKINKKIKDDLSIAQKQARYIKAMPKINNAFSHIHEISRLLDEELKKENSNVEYLENIYSKSVTLFKSFCDEIASAFNDIHNTPCSVCIKLLYDPEDDESQPKNRDLAVKTFVRDKESHKARHRNQDSSFPYYISENSSYEYITAHYSEQTGRCYFNNAIPFTPTYKNSSWATRGGPPTINLNSPEEEVINDWRRLCYLSQITTAICPNIPEKFNRTYFRGFLGVDAAEMNVFDQENDCNLMIGIADGLYNAIEKYYALLVKISSKKTQVQ